MMQDFWSFQAKDLINVLILLVTVWAIYFGPIRAVVVARREETKAARIKQKAEIFASLMKTRRFQLDAEHVSALNLIQVYFNDEAAVLASYKAYIRLLSRRALPGIADDSLFKERDDAFIDLVSEIARALGYPQDKKELQELAYSPEGWATDNATIKKLHSLMVEVFEQRRAIPITNLVSVAQNNPFPPAPSDN
ncbi:DUF6680 family protein [Rhizobium sp. P44RR-XXIV]|uniref:DUF6680 family protein n=1 Tax=Rhizobium sp. P44RR-XXIV TaxID=1921145 RepID=UPI00098519F0|nr:DUF6680 family protein [Rhizobium sp. P44RR-XXIV]TIX89158.1 hypothetical protein BSK43_021345 [Rhizobium sp. P44RR-XXIV]